MPNKLVSIIIPVYNSEPYLKRCLDSVVNQTLSDIEIICINDGSTDNSLECLKKYTAQDSRIKIINFTDNCGVAVARNAGIKAAVGEYIGFVDSDDYVDLDFYEKLYSHSQCTDADIIKGSDSKVIYPDGRVKIDKVNYNIKKNKLHFWHQHYTAIYRLDFILKNHIEFPPGLLVSEDSVFVTKAAILANKIDVIDDAQYYYCRRKDSLNSEVWGHKKILSYASHIEIVVDLVLQSALKDRDRRLIFNRLRADVCLHKKLRCYFDVEHLAIFDDLIAKLEKVDKKKFPVKLLFDGTKLAHDINEMREYRSGIFWVIFNLVKQFLKDTRFDVTIFLKHNEKRNVLKSFPEFKNCKFACSFYSISNNGKLYAAKHPIFNITNYNAYFRVDYYNDIDDAAGVLPHFSLLHDAIPLLADYDNDFGVRFYRFYKTVLTKNSYCFCVSQSCKDDFLRFFPALDESKMTVTHTAAANKFHPGKDANKIKDILKKYGFEHGVNKNYLFTLSTLSHPRKQTFFQIKCFLKFIKKCKIDDLYFYLGGGDRNAHESVRINLKNYLGDLYDENKIRFLGYVDDEDVNILYANSLFFTYISLYEGFGIPPLEAMDAGVPVVTANNSSLPEVVGDAAIMVDAQDEDAIIHAYETLYFNPELREEYIKRGFERAKMFNWEKTYKIISDKILEVLGVEG